MREMNIFFLRMKISTQIIQIIMGNMSVGHNYIDPFIPGFIYLVSGNHACALNFRASTSLLTQLIIKRERAQYGINSMMV